MKSIAFITRVHPQRPKMLKVCVSSIKAQTDDDYIHIIFKDDKTENGYRVVTANKALARVPPIDARYVMILDDDDMLIEPDFVKILKKTIQDGNPEIVFFKGTVLGKGTFPRPEQWRKHPSRGGIASFCFAVRLDVWKKYIHRFNRRSRSGGDFFFIASCYENTENHIWLNRIVARTQKRAGKGKAEQEHA